MKFLVSDDSLTVTFQGWERLWGLRRKLVIPRSAITGVSWSPQFEYSGERFFRAGGTGLPGVLYAGNFRAAGAWYFLFVRRPRGNHWLTGGTFMAPDVLEITTQGYTYKRLLLSCRPDIGTSLVNWFEAPPGS